MSDQRERFVAAQDIKWIKVADNVRVEKALLDSTDIYYRYASLPEAIQLVSKGAISFSDPRVWPDKYERYGMASLFDSDGVFSDISVFAKCFSGSSSSEALWRIYGAEEPVVRYGYSLTDLIDQLMSASSSRLSNIYVAKVQYVSPPEVQRVINDAGSGRAVSSRAAKALFYKRKAFDHESELRVVLTRKNDGKNSASMQLKGFDRDLITRILIDPYIPEWQSKVLIELFKKSLGFNGRVGRSRFDEDLPLNANP